MAVCVRPKVDWLSVAYASAPEGQVVLEYQPNVNVKQREKRRKGSRDCRKRAEEGAEDGGA